MRKKLSITTRALAILSTLLVVGVGLLGTLLINQSRSALRTQIQHRMLDIANTAAAMLDGDALETLTAEDANTEAYQEVMDTLTVFQDHVELAYIYCIRKTGERRFIFTVDPTVGDPAFFGQTVKYTEALDEASTGVPTVDQTPYADEWGSFYSAYSPVYNSAGAVVGLVVVDFRADWFDRQIRNQMVTTGVALALSLLMGAVLVLMLTSGVRDRFHELNEQMKSLTGDVEALAKEVQIPLSHGYPAREQGFGPLSSDDEVSELGEKIRATHRQLQEYIRYVQGQAFTDPMTGVGNKTAYLDTVKRLKGKISTNMASFFIVVFDINGLKTINDNLGHEYGDDMISDAAQALKKVFGAERVFRIGGDEFIAVLENASQAEVDALFARLDEEVDAFNRGGKRYEADLAISKGAAAYERGRDKQYREIFKRADEAMYRDKDAYYRRTGKHRKGEY